MNLTPDKGGYRPESLYAALLLMGLATGAFGAAWYFTHQPPPPQAPIPVSPPTSITLGAKMAGATVLVWGNVTDAIGRGVADIPVTIYGIGNGTTTLTTDALGHFGPSNIAAPIGSWGVMAACPSWSAGHDTTLDSNPQGPFIFGGAWMVRP